MFFLLKKLDKVVTKKRKINFFILIFCMVISSIAELLSIAIFVPFISIILDSNKFDNVRIYLIIREILGDQFILFLILFMIFIFIISSLIRVFTLTWQNRFAANLGNEIVFKAYDSILNENYEDHIKQPKSNLISIINNNGNKVFIEVFAPILLLTESIIFISLMIFLLLIYNWKLLLSVSFLLFIIYAFFIKKAYKRLNISGKKLVDLNKKTLERLDVELNSIEFIQLGNYQRKYSTNYAKYDREYKLLTSDYIVTSRIPKLTIEYVFLIILLILILFLYINNSISNTLPLLASGALLAQRFFPYLQKAFESWTSIVNYKDTFYSVINYALKYKNIKNSRQEHYENIKFNLLTFKNVSFSYEDKNEIISDINFSIRKGEKIAIMGPSGTGKTTILRLLCGLLNPISGKILINGKEINKKNNNENKINWMRSIGYVPQKINLTGNTLRENITFGKKSRTKNPLKIEDIIKITLLEELVERCNGLDSDFFQNSFSLSGGENQRLAIARALYRNPELLIMDEPTSSLDVNTQKKLFDNLLKVPNMTCIVITHRIETKYFFDRILKIKNKKLFEK